MSDSTTVKPSAGEEATDMEADFETSGTDTAVETEETTAGDQKPKRQPRYHVVLWDDDDHSYDYVIKMMKRLFGHDHHRGYEMACEVDRTGRVICLTTTLEHGELKREQVHAFGKDSLIAHCAGSMSCSLEPAE